MAGDEVFLVNKPNPAWLRSHTSQLSSVYANNLTLLSFSLKNPPNRHAFSQHIPQRRLAEQQEWTLVTLALLQDYKAHIDVNATEPESDWTALHFASAAPFDNTQAVKALLAAGADINRQAKRCYYSRELDRYTPLHLAIEFNNFNVFNLLLNEKPNLELSGGYFGTPLNLAIFYRRADMVVALIDAGAKFDSFLLVNAMLEEAEMKHWQSLYPDSHTDEDENEMVGWRKIKNAILKNKTVNVNAHIMPAYLPGRYTHTSDLHYYGGHYRNKNQDRALDVAFSIYKSTNDDLDEKFVCDLIAAGADFTRFYAGAKSGTPYLVYAAAQGWTTIVSTLLNKGADINAQCRDGNTALHYAIKNKHYGTAIALLAKSPYIKREKTNELLIDLLKNLNEKQVSVIVNQIVKLGANVTAEHIELAKKQPSNNQETLKCLQDKFAEQLKQVALNDQIKQAKVERQLQRELNTTLWPPSNNSNPARMEIELAAMGASLTINHSKNVH